MVRLEIAGAVYFVRVTTCPEPIESGPVKITSVPLAEIDVGNQATESTVTPKFVVFTAGKVLLIVSS